MTIETFEKCIGICNDDSGNVLGGYVSKDFVLVNFFQHACCCICYGNELYKMISYKAIDTFSERYDAAELTF